MALLFLLLLLCARHFWFSYEDRRDTERRFEADPQDLRHSLISRRRSDVTDRLDDRREEQRPDVRYCRFRFKYHFDIKVQKWFVPLPPVTPIILSLILYVRILFSLSYLLMYTSACLLPKLENIS